MPKQVRRFKILITSPSDVTALRDEAREAILQWNSARSDECDVVLMPIMWERDAVPAQGARAQDFINDQLVDDADVVIGIFHSRLGTPTGLTPSGSVEEIERFVDSRRPTAVFFCEAPLPYAVDLSQLQAVRDYRATCEGRGLVAAFIEPYEFRAKLHNYLSHTIPCRDSEMVPGRGPSPMTPAAPASLELFFRHEFPMWWEAEAWYRVGVRNRGHAVAENVVVTLLPIDPNPLPLNVLPAQLGKKDGGEFDCRINPGDEAFFDVVRHWPPTPDLLQLWTVPAKGQEFRLDPDIEYRTAITVSAANAPRHGPVSFVLRQRRGEELWFDLVASAPPQT